MVDTEHEGIKPDVLKCRTQHNRKPCSFYGRRVGCVPNRLIYASHSKNYLLHLDAADRRWQRRVGSVLFSWRCFWGLGIQDVGTLGFRTYDFQLLRHDFGLGFRRGLDLRLEPKRIHV